MVSLDIQGERIQTWRACIQVSMKKLYMYEHVQFVYGCNFSIFLEFEFKSSVFIFQRIAGLGWA